MTHMTARAPLRATRRRLPDLSPPVVDATPAVAPCRPQRRLSLQTRPPLPKPVHARQLI